MTMTLNASWNPPKETMLPVARLTATIGEAAQMLGVCEKTIYNLINDGTLKKVNLGIGRTLLSRRQIESLVNGNETTIDSL